MENNRAMNPPGTLFASHSQAEDYLRDYIKDNPSKAGQFHVIPQFEVSP